MQTDQVRGLKARGPSRATNEARSKRGGTTEILKDLIGRRVIAGVDPGDGILGLGAF